MISVLSFPSVKIRCQFDSVPGVTHIEMSIVSRDELAGTVHFFGGFGPKLTFGEETIQSVLSGGKPIGDFILLDAKIYAEISEAIKNGLDSLVTMKKSVEPPKPKFSRGGLFS